MKKHTYYIAALAAAVLASCAEDNVADFQIEKPDSVVEEEQMSSYGPLLDYIAPSFKLGNTLTLEEFSKKGALTTVTTTNFNEITLSGAFAHSKCVSDEGEVNSQMTDVNFAVEYAKEHGLSVFGGPLLNSDVNSTYLNTKIVEEKKEGDAPKIVETIDLLAENFEEGKLPVGWRCEDGDGVHEYPNEYGSGPRSFEGFTGYKGKALYWRVKYAEYGTLTDCPLTLKAGEYKLDFAVAAWSGAANYYVEILDASDNSIAKSDAFAASPDAGGQRTDVSSAAARELSFVITKDGNYKIRFVNKDGTEWRQFLLLDCKVDVYETNDAPEEPKYPEESKLAAETEIKNYVTAMVGDNLDIPAWTVAENPVTVVSCIWNRALGSSYVDIAAKAARAANSSAKLFVSEKGLEDADVRAALADLLKTASDIDGIDVIVSLGEDTDLSAVFTDLAATGKLVRLNIQSFEKAEYLAKALTAYKSVPEAQRYGVSFAKIDGIWNVSSNFNRTKVYQTIVDALK